MSDEEFGRLLATSYAALRNFTFGMLGRCGRLMEIDDIVQDAALKAWDMRATFTPGSNFKAWVMTIARNHIISTGRRSFRIVQWDDEVHPQMLTTKPAAESVVELRHVRRAMQSLTPEHRKALELAGEGLTMAELADKLGIPLATAKSRLFRARDALQHQVERPHRGADAAQRRAIRDLLAAMKAA